MSLSPHEFDREARLLIRRMLRCDGRLERGPRGGWALLSARNAYGKPVAGVDEAVVHGCRDLGLLESRPDGRLAAAATARGWLKADPAGRPARRLARVRHDDGSLAEVEIDDAESPLAWLAGRRDAEGRPLISPDELAAGERLRRDYTLARLEARVTASWDMTILSGARGRSGLPGQALTPGEAAMAARRRVAGALAAVGTDLSGILIEVCCLASGLEHAERRLGWPQRSGKVILRIALRQLARHYGIVPARRAAPTAQWGLDGYRPELTVPPPGVSGA